MRHFLWWEVFYRSSLHPPEGTSERQQFPQKWRRLITTDLVIVKDMLKRVRVWVEEILHCLCLWNRESTRLKESSWGERRWKVSSFGITAGLLSSQTLMQLSKEALMQRSITSPHVWRSSWCKVSRVSSSSIAAQTLRWGAGEKTFTSASHLFPVFSPREESTRTTDVTFHHVSHRVASSAAAQIKITHD